ncbi:hypothetical protein LCGC14_0337870 [marine sediment metagenome]|uniref:Uncharacterized protein n=1 Tax=marine sediment metagenome TaxID=412755 RepID=A0A0F9WLX5_9ZZZZ
MVSDTGVFRRRPDYFLAMRRPRRMPTLTPAVVADARVLHTPQNYIDWSADKQPKRIPVVM